MSEVFVEMLEKVEDRGGALQPLLQVTGLTKHFPVRGDLFWGHTIVVSLAQDRKFKDADIAG